MTGFLPDSLPPEWGFGNLLPSTAGLCGCLACGPSRLGTTERAAPQILSLPIYPQLSDEAVDRDVAEIRALFR